LNACVSRLLLLRHGQSTWNAEHRWQGWADPPLSEVGRDQAQVAGQVLRSAGFGVVVASDLTRARETAEIIAAEVGVDDVQVEAGLRERDVGAWSGLTTDEIEARWPGQLAAWRAGELTVIPEGEGDIEERVIAAVERVLMSHPGDTVLAVTHGGVIRTVERALGVEPSTVRNLGGRWISIEGDGHLVAGRTVTLRDPDAPPATTTVL
jgi:probable phosphoglycerate mutase